MEVNTPGITKVIKSNTGCDTDYFMVIPEVIQARVGSTAGITITALKRAYIERVLGRFWPP